MALAAACTTLENGYRSYRERVAAKVGESVEKDILLLEIFIQKKRNKRRKQKWRRGYKKINKNGLI